MRPLIAAACLASFATSAAVAQDVTPAFDMGVLTNTLSQDAVTQSERQRAGQMAMPSQATPPSLAGAALSSSFRGLGLAPGGPAAGSPAPAAGPPLPYNPTRQLEQQASAEFVARLRNVNPRSADALATLLARHGYTGEFRRYLRDTPLTDRDAADSMTMFLVMGYLIANQDMRDVPASQWLAVRNQVRAALARSPRFSDAATRAALGEEMKILSVILYGGFDGNQKAGGSRQYANGVATMLRQKMGLDPRSLTLTDSGFVRR